MVFLASGRGSYLQSNGTFFAAARLETGPGPESVDGDGACVFFFLSLVVQGGPKKPMNINVRRDCYC